jgi:hypothetical protein
MAESIKSQVLHLATWQGNYIDIKYEHFGEKGVNFTNMLY